MIPKSPKLQRESGSGKEVLSRIVSVKANGTGSFQHEKVCIREAQELVYASRRVQRPRCH